MKLHQRATPSRRQQAAAETRRRIVAAARRLFHDRGFEAATTTDIAEAASVAKGTLFLHARTKERLLALVYEEDIAAVIRRGFALPPRTKSIAVALGAALERFFHVYESDRALARHFVREVMFMRMDEAAELRHLTDRTLAGLASMIEEGKARSLVAADVDPSVAAVNSFLLYYGVLTGWLTGWLPDAAARDRALADSLALHWRGLAPAGAPRRRA